MKNAIILHGMPSKTEHYKVNGQSNSNKHWLPWLQHELIIHDILAQTPELPLPYEPVYQNWLEVFQGFPVNNETLLVGHSCGGGFLLGFLSENNVKVGKVALVAPWIDPHDKLKTGFFDFILDSNLVVKTDGVKIFSSQNDSKEILDGTNIILETVKGIEIEEFENMGHFCFGDMKTDEFPQLREYLLS